MIGGVVLVVAGAMVVVTGALGWAARLPRNRWAGVRTRATMGSDRGFEVGNRVAAPMVVAGGVAGMAAGVAAVIAGGGAATLWALAGTVVMVVLVLAGGVRGDRAARAAG